jgi:predicted transposase YbfD/YdcC
MDAVLDGFFSKPSLKALLASLAVIDDPRDPWRVMYPLREVLFLAICGTICGCDSYEEIAEWGKVHRPFLRRYLPYENGTAGGRWLTIFMNRINPALFEAAFRAFVRACWPDKPEFVAIDGKTSRRSHDRARGMAPLHLVSAFASTAKLVLASQAVAEKACEITAIPELIEKLAVADGLAGSLVTIDAIATNPVIAQAILEAKASYLLAVKGNQETLAREIAAYFDAAPPEHLGRCRDIDKGHGRIETRIAAVASEVDWLSGERRYPGELRLPGIKTIIRIETKTELKDRCRAETRYFIASLNLSARQALDAVRSHWAIENSLHWVLDVTFNEDQSRLRKGHGALNMAIIRHFAINLVRAVNDKKTIKLRRKSAGWNPNILADILGMLPC